jgi:hypothetical protein
MSTLSTVSTSLDDHAFEREISSKSVDVQVFERCLQPACRVYIQLLSVTNIAGCSGTSECRHNLAVLGMSTFSSLTVTMIVRMYE